MIPYFVLIALPVLTWMVRGRYRLTFGGRPLYETRSVSIDVFMLVFFLLLAFRGLDCGNDTMQYERLFEEYRAQSIPQLLKNYNYEWGYKILNRFLAVVGGEYQTLLAVTSLICVYPLWYFYKRESEEQLLTIALFITVAPFVMYFSGIRQAISMSMGIAAWYCARKKKLVRFLLVILLAMQFHQSAYILLVLYPLYHVRITRRWLWFVIPCMALVYVFRTQIFSVLLVLMWEDFGEVRETGATSVLLLLIMLAVYSYIIPDESRLDQDTIAMRNILLLTVTIQVFAMLHTLAMRMNYYYLIYIPILIPKIANRSKKKYRQIAELSVVVMTVFFLCYFLRNMIMDIDDLNIFPYIPFWK